MRGNNGEKDGWIFLFIVNYVLSFNASVLNHLRWSSVESVVYFVNCINWAKQRENIMFIEWDGWTDGTQEVIDDRCF